MKRIKPEQGREEWIVMREITEAAILTREEKIRRIQRRLRKPDGINDSIINIVYRITCE